MKNFYIILIILFFGVKSYSQTPNKHLINPVEKLSFPKKQFKGFDKKTEVIQFNEKSTQTQKTPIVITQSNDERAGKMLGEFSVSPNGSANYYIPFTLPPGIKNLIPTIGLSYASQSGNGIAGIGWNIAGLSTITRIPSTEYHDGNIDEVDFDGNDRFALDGMRLVLKSGSYGANNAVYESEIYSNVKVISYGTSTYGGPSYFKVIYPDGTISYYGNGGGSLGRLEWAIFKKIDPQGNFIEFSYDKTNELLRPRTIAFGSRGSTTSPNIINFYYNNRKRPQLSYKNGISFKRTKILDKVEIVSSGNLFRKYDFSFEQTSLGYERLIEAEEFNSNNVSYPKIFFEYNNSANSITRINDQYGSIVPGVDSRYDDIRVGDADADGHQDLLVFRKTDKSKFFYFNSVINNGQSVAQQFDFNFDNIFFSSIINHLGSNVQNQGITLQEENISGGNSIVNFRNFLKAPSGLSLQYTKNFTFPIGPAGTFYCGAPNNDDYRIIPKKFISGDFNGDGLTDVIAITGQYKIPFCDEVPTQDPDIDECDCDFTNWNTPNEAYLLDLNRQLSSTTPLNLGQVQSSVTGNDRLIAADFNGDGKSDLIHIEDNSIKVYSLNLDNNAIELIASKSDSSIDLDKPILTGDFNGDGLFDMATSTSENSSNWRFFLSKGNSIYNYTKNTNVSFQKSELKNGTYNVNGVTMVDPIYEYKYIAIDINGDGNSDILKHEVVSPYASTTISSERMWLYENRYSEFDTTPSFTNSATLSDTNNGMAKFGLPVFLESEQSNGNLEYAYIIQSRVFGYEFNKDYKVDSELEKITNDGLIIDINYENLTYDVISDPSFDRLYTSSYDQDYPYVNVNIAPSLKIVKDVQKNGSGITQSQEYYYNGAVTTAHGLGFLGYEYLRRSNWHGSGVGILISGSKHNMQKYGAIEEDWTSTGLGLSPTTNFSSKKTYNYNSTFASNQRFTNLPINIITENGLHDYIKTESYLYGIHNLPSSITSSFPGGFNKLEYTYSNNSGSTNSSYHIGRILSKKETNNLDGHTFSSEEQYTYSNNLATQHKKKGMGTPFLIENLTYDVFGNITNKVISGPSIANRSESFVYDSSGRFLLSSTDIKGLTTTTTFDTFSGKPISLADPFGKTTSFTYDGWQRILTETNYLNKETKYVYNKTSLSGVGRAYTTSINYPEGQDEKVWINVFGWEILKERVRLNGKKIRIKTNFDASGRQSSVSEPYFSTTSPTNWTSSQYDINGRLSSKTLPNGRVINNTFNGLITNVDDGVNLAITTKDVLGNIISLQDAGGTINYKYFANGVIKEAVFDNNTVTSTIDGWGRKASMNDPVAGNYTYQYNILGEITEETSPKGQTIYTYNSQGLLETKSITGDLTDLELNYNYNPISKLVTSVNGSDYINQKNYTYTYTYDSFYRPIKIEEATPDAEFIKEITYDSFGRQNVETIETTSLSTNTVSEVQTRFSYDANGILNKLYDDSTNTLLWSATSANERDQYREITLGNGIIKERSYTSLGLYSRIKDKASGMSPVVDMEYDWNLSRNTLIRRTNHTLSNWQEVFGHDDLNRLTTITGPVSRSHSYDQKGRITQNSVVGSYNYTNTNKPYQLMNVDLNVQGDINYQQDYYQTVAYNAFKKPISITNSGRGKVDFEYGPLMNRTYAYYGGQENNPIDREFSKLYSSITSVEIIKNNNTGAVKIITYVGGNEYTAALVHITNKTISAPIENDYFYIHRDYLGSILAITDENANIIESAQYGAWGTIDHFESGQGNNFETDSLLSRGFTGHEHFTSVGLIHMNGRMYDANLGRFLSPDNFVQNPYNSQSFNRYSYVWNNPLTLNDPSGEFIITAIIIAAAVFAVGNVVAHAIRGDIDNFWDGVGYFFQGAVAGAAIGAVLGAAILVFPVVGTVLTYAAIAYGVAIASSILSGVAVGVIDGDWSRLQNSAEIFIGNFYLDENRTFFGGVLQGLTRFTYEIPQVIIGGSYSQFRNTFGSIDEVQFFGGATFTISENNEDRNGISLGNFININIRNEYNADGLGIEGEDGLYLHEYGHTFQSQRFGLSYLFAVGIPSALGGEWTETSANRWAFRYINAQFNTPTWNYPLRPLN